MSLFLWQFFINNIISSYIYVTLFYIIVLVFLGRYSANNVYGKHLWMEVIRSQVSDLYSELLAVSSSEEDSTFIFACILYIDYPYQFYINLSYSLLFLIVCREYFSEQLKVCKESKYMLRNKCHFVMKMYFDRHFIVTSKVNMVAHSFSLRIY